MSGGSPGSCWQAEPGRTVLRDSSATDNCHVQRLSHMCKGLLGAGRWLRPPHRPRLLTTTGSGTASRGCSGGWHVHMRAEMTSGRGSGAAGSCVTCFLASAACRYLRQVSSQPLHRRAGRQQQQHSNSRQPRMVSRQSRRRPPTHKLQNMQSAPKCSCMHATGLPVVLQNPVPGYTHRSQPVSHAC